MYYSIRNINKTLLKMLFCMANESKGWFPTHMYIHFMKYIPISQADPENKIFYWSNTNIYFVLAAKFSLVWIINVGPINSNNIGFSQLYIYLYVLQTCLYFMYFLFIHANCKYYTYILVAQLLLQTLFIQWMPLAF